MSAPTWARLHRGVVWHVVAKQGVVGTLMWCGKAENAQEETDGQPPRGARPCRECCVAVQEFAALVDNAVVLARPIRPAMLQLEQSVADRPDAEHAHLVEATS